MTTTATGAVESERQGNEPDGNGGLNQPTSPWIVEYSKTGRATCRACDAKIIKGDVRIGHTPLFRGKPGYMVYRHLHCAVFSEEVQCAEDVENYEALRMEDYSKLAEQVHISHTKIREEYEELRPDELVQVCFHGEDMRSEQPRGLNATLLPFQVEGYSWMYHQEVQQVDVRGGILADEMVGLCSRFVCRRIFCVSFGFAVRFILSHPHDNVVTSFSTHTHSHTLSHTHVHLPLLYYTNGKLQGMGKTIQTIATILDHRPKLQHAEPGMKHPPTADDLKERQEEDKLWGKAREDWATEMELLKVPKKFTRSSHGGSGGGARAGTLVICPVIALTQWKTEIEKFTEEGSLTVGIYHGPDRASQTPRDLMRKYDVVLTTYQGKNAFRTESFAYFRLDQILLLTFSAISHL